MSLTDYFTGLLRVQQWYKNLLVFAAVFFSGNLLVSNDVLSSLIGFVSLCLVSSAGYILNDIFDYRRDRFNPEKKTRPIASGKISKLFAGLISTVLYAIGFYIAYKVDIIFLLIAVIISAITLIYSVWLKNVVFADMILISTNFVLRALAGVAIINVELTPWFFLAIFFFAFFLVAGKRHGDLLFLKGSAKKYKPVLKFYDVIMLKGVINIFMSCLIIIFGLYAYFSGRMWMLAIYPLLIFILFRYYFLIYSGDSAVRNPEKMVKDIPLVALSLLFAAGMFGIIYLL